MLSAYDMLQKNVVEPDIAYPEGNYVTQTGARRVELSGTADLSAAYTYMEGVIAASDQADAGNQAADVPHNMASVWIDKTFQQGRLHGFGVGGGIRYTGAQFGDEANALRMPSFTPVDAALHYDIGHWRFAVNARNLFDRIHVNCQASAYCTYGLRRNAVGRATYLR